MRDENFTLVDSWQKIKQYNYLKNVLSPYFLPGLACSIANVFQCQSSIWENLCNCIVSFDNHLSKIIVCQQKHHTAATSHTLEYVTQTRFNVDTDHLLVFYVSDLESLQYNVPPNKGVILVIKWNCHRCKLEVKLMN